MSYLQNRVANFDKFKAMIGHPNSQQCGSSFKLVDHDGTVFEPTLKFLGAGAYGIAFELENRRLSSKNINVVLKVANTTKHGKSDDEVYNEIFFNLWFSNEVEEGRCMHFPLFSNCKENGGAPNAVDDPADAYLAAIEKLVLDCDCGPSIGGNGGCSFVSSRIAQLSMQDRVKVRHISNTLQNGCLVSFSEKYDGNLDDYLMSISGRNDLDQNEQDRHMLIQIMNATVQLIFALSEMNKLKFSHSDTHTGNIFYKRLEGDEDPHDFQYEYQDDDGDEYKLTSQSNKLYILADFGFTGKKIEGEKMHNLNEDITNGSFLDDLKDGCDNATKNAMNGANYKKWKRSSLYDLYRFMLSLIYYGLNPNRTIKYPNVVIFVSSILIFLYNKLKQLESDPIQQVDYNPLTFFNDIPTVLPKRHEVLLFWNIQANRTKKCECNAYNDLKLETCASCGKNLCKGGICSKIYKRFFGFSPKKSTKKSKKTVKTKKSIKKTVKSKKSIKKTVKSKKSIKKTVKTKKSIKNSKRSSKK
jgi:hypothetical protein